MHKGNRALRSVVDATAMAEDCNRKGEVQEEKEEQAKEEEEEGGGACRRRGMREQRTYSETISRYSGRPAHPHADIATSSTRITG